MTVPTGPSALCGKDAIVDSPVESPAYHLKLTKRY